MLLSILIGFSSVGRTQIVHDVPQCRHIAPEGIDRRSEAVEYVTATDLIRLRDLVTIPSSQTPPFALSPDGRTVAIDLQQADPATNSRCLAVLTLDVSSSARPKVLFESGEAIPELYTRDGISEQSLGSIANQMIKWSPDGEWLGHLVREKGVTQVRLTKRDGSRSFTLTRSPTNIENYAWTKDGKAIVWASRIGLVEARKSADDEAHRGLHYDFRTRPALNMNAPGVYSPLAYYVQNIDSFVSRSTTEMEKRAAGDKGENVPDGAISSSVSLRGDIAFSVRDDKDYYYSATTIHAQSHDGKVAVCFYEQCRSNIKGIWWSLDGASVFFMRREGWNDSETAMYRWKPYSSRQPRRLWATEDLLEGCKSYGAKLICAYEDSKTPRRLVWVDRVSGKISQLFDPNPEFSRFRLGTVKRFRWKNDVGLEAFGDLVLPPGHKSGERHPLIIVQYRSRGFLRGGTGDEYPIFALAARGYAVLSFDRPTSPALTNASVKTMEQANAASSAGLADRLNVHSALLKGLDLVEASGAIDTKRIGITGLSDGSATVQFALINSRRFSAGAESNCCDDRLMQSLAGGPLHARLFKERGEEAAVAYDWKEDRRISYVAHARCWRIPLLFQLPGNEYRYGLRVLAAFADSNAPVDAYIFPDEYHIKSQPMHKLAVYERNIDWFDFWLRGIENPSPERQPEYVRWRSMRASLKESKPGCPLPD